LYEIVGDLADDLFLDHRVHTAADRVDTNGYFADGSDVTLVGSGHRLLDFSEELFERDVALLRHHVQPLQYFAFHFSLDRRTPNKKRTAQGPSSN